MALPRRPVFEVVERLRGDMTTDFGAPSQPAAPERRSLDAAQARRLAALLRAAWTELEEIAARTPEELTKGPRGGGRDRTKMLDHVRDAEYAYARQVAVRLTPKKASWAELRAALIDAIEGATGRPPDEWKWPPAYFARRTAWHALDHAWEMEDRTPA